MRDFLKNTLATVVGLALFLSLGVTGLVVLAIAIASSSHDSGPTVEKNSILTLDLSQGITDAPSADDPQAVIGAALSGDRPGRNEIPLRHVLEGLKAAAKDDHIVGLYVHGNTSAVTSGSGFATLREVRQGLEQFRSSGKPIYAYDDSTWKERDYYLASVANKILLHPSALLEINGFSLETAFYAGALQKYGVGVQVLRVGRYKSFVEQFTRSSSSPEEREQSQKLLADLWNEFRSATTTSRKLAPEALQAIADKQGLLLSDQAKSAKLIDAVAYDDEVVAQLRSLTKEDADADSFRQIDLDDYAQILPADQRSSDRKIAVVYAEGEIVGGEGGIGSIGGDSLARQLRELRQDDDIKAVVLRVNSPGGSAAASEEIAREVMLMKQKKPVIVSMGSAAASGGYQISAHANRIFASPTTITGSIGVFGLLINVQQLANKNGITWDYIKTGHFANSQTISRPKTAEEMAIGQKVVDHIYDRFLDIVAESRPISRQKIAEIAQGRVWSGLAAQKLGLVDELGGLDDAIAAAAKMAKLGDDWELDEYPKGRSLRIKLLTQLLSSRLGLGPSSSSTVLDPISQELQHFKGDLDRLRWLNDPRGMYSRLPFNLRID